MFSSKSSRCSCQESRGTTIWMVGEFHIGGCNIFVILLLVKWGDNNTTFSVFLWLPLLYPVFPAGLFTSWAKMLLIACYQLFCKIFEKTLELKPARTLSRNLLWFGLSEFRWVCCFNSRGTAVWPHKWMFDFLCFGRLVPHICFWWYHILRIYEPYDCESSAAYKLLIVW